jgi:cytochrome b6-f complex iron-sulfur subunit
MSQEQLGRPTDGPASAASDAPEPVPAPVPGSSTPLGSPLPEATGTADGPITSRRRFLRWLLGFSVVSTAALVATPVVAFLVPPKTGSAGAGGKVPVGTLTDIPLGHGKVVAMGSKPAIVINTDQGVKAYSAICTHLGCIVAFDDTNGMIICPCHDGHFNPTTGAVVSGPPPAPLDSITVSVEGDEISLVGA